MVDVLMLKAAGAPFSSAFVDRRRQLWSWAVAARAWLLPRYGRRYVTPQIVAKSPPEA